MHTAELRLDHCIKTKIGLIDFVKLNKLPYNKTLTRMSWLR